MFGRTSSLLFAFVSVQWTVGFANADVAQSVVFTPDSHAREEITRMHNEERASVTPSATNMQVMRYKTSVEQKAGEWAGECTFAHSEQRIPDDYQKHEVQQCGENLFRETFDPNKTTDATFSGATYFVRAMETWAAEKASWNYGVGKKDTGGSVGHYTQMIWNHTNEVGCALGRCHGGWKPNWVQVVCQYCPTGNLIGMQGTPYSSGPSASECDANNKCSSFGQKLCVPPCYGVYDQTSATCKAKTLPDISEVCGNQVGGGTNESTTGDTATAGDGSEEGSNSEPKEGPLSSGNTSPQSKWFTLLWVTVVILDIGNRYWRN